jgi:hypothetical protein
MCVIGKQGENLLKEWEMTVHQLKKFCFLCIAMVLLVSGCNSPSSRGGGSGPPSGRAPTGDYGDAPEGGPTGYPAGFAQTGSFPTTFASNGARTLDTGEATLGPGISAEEDADDPNDPDGVPNLTNTDPDDGLIDFFITLTAIPPPTTLTVLVNGPQGSSGGMYWLNAVIDLNLDGEWGGRGINGEMEWAVQNEIVQVAPGVTTPYTTQPFAFSNGNTLPDGAFMRIALTKEMVPPDWDGTGEFSAGEIEDYFIRLPDLGGGKTGILMVDCDGPYRPGQMVTCNVFGGNGRFTYALVGPFGGNVPVFAGRCNPAPVGGPLTAPVAVTCPSGPGKTPTTWRFVITSRDPKSISVDGGIITGYTDESSSEFNFEGTPKDMSVFVLAMEGSYVHYSGYSMVLVDASVYGDDPAPMANANIDLTMKGPGGSETQTVTTDEDGTAHAEFTIYTYGNYEVSVDNIEGEYMVYDPSLNAMNSVKVSVTAGESTPVGGTTEIGDFVFAFNKAFQTKDAGALFDLLHPAVTDLYGDEACHTYIGSIIETPTRLEVLNVKELASWLWEMDGHSTSFEDVFIVEVNFTAADSTSQVDFHLVQREDGTLGWFTDCGEPLQ